MSSAFWDFLFLFHTLVNNPSWNVLQSFMLTIFDSVVVCFLFILGVTLKFTGRSQISFVVLIVIFYQQFQNYLKLLSFKIRNNFHFLTALVSFIILVTFWYLKKYFLEESVLCITSFTVYILFAYARNLELCWGTIVTYVNRYGDKCRSLCRSLEFWVKDHFSEWKLDSSQSSWSVIWGCDRMELKS